MNQSPRTPCPAPPHSNDGDPIPDGAPPAIAEGAGPPTRSRAALERAGTFLFARRNLLFPLILVALLGLLRPLPAFGDWALDRWTDALGLLLALCGEALRIATIGQAGIQRGGHNGRVHAAELVTSGTLAHVRNPLYLGNMLIAAGLFAIHNNPWVYLVALPATLFAYRALVAAEEAYLSERFGEAYRRYCRQVPRWVPRLRGLARSLAAGHFDAGEALIKGYAPAYAWIVCAAGIMAEELLQQPESPERAAALSVLAGVFGVMTFGWAAIGLRRRIERRRRIRVSG